MLTRAALGELKLYGFSSGFILIAAVFQAERRISVCGKLSCETPSVGVNCAAFGMTSQLGTAQL